MGRFIRLGALACLYLGAESKALRWQADTPSWSPPKQTIAAMDMLELGFSPAPTAAPDPGNVELKLAKRVRGDDTCGYISGISRRPECNTYVYSDSVFSKYTLFNCAVTEARIIVYANPTDTTGDATTEATTAPTSDRTTGGLSPITSSASPSAATTSPASSGGGSSTPIGAIVGGVVGGLAVIALIAVGIFFILRSKKKNNQNNTQVTPGTYNPQQPPPGQQPQMYQAAPTQQQQPSPGGYAPAPTTPGNFPSGFTPVDNRQSMLKQPYDVSAASYDHNNGVSPPASPPPMSPSPTYQSGIPAYAQQGSGPSPTQGGYPVPQQQQQQQPPQQFYNAPPPAQTQQQQQQTTSTTSQTHYHHNSFASELPATRGDSELRELA
ncbi:unnamed protein product [Colletotrichum noveboracense]|uniref:Uncharacterized protein n=1 Tax=Colletotrichum noveboracense TaxID=2664923 RepID=A0A9W4S3G3_9PEZI|nr:hypothetical protein COL940_000930 [Colletotrichum noveboracense]KAJ0294846.1 hypothetical protein CBS470a_000352 [Colletotrichum nupharicola]CAI0652266.1 unnamed protein product [Colletotrichum noveboracense]